MIRKLFLLTVMVIAVTAFAVSTASANDPEGVHVENPGFYEVESEVDLAVVSHSLSGVETPHLQCKLHGDLEIGEDGTGVLHAEDSFTSHIDPTSTGPCNEVQPCDHEPWPISFEEDEDAVPPAEFGHHFVPCFQGTPLPAIPQPVECDVVEDITTGVRCDAPVYGGVLEVQGEFRVHGLVGLMHADR